MTKEEIIEGNKLIAEFMGGVYDSDVNEYWFYLNPPNWTSKFAPTTYELKYHSSWDWLMPVVEKIENDLKDSFNVDIVNNNQCEIVKNGSKFICGYGFETVYNSKIEAVYYSVVAFIKWYNSCKKDLY